MNSSMYDDIHITIRRYEDKFKVKPNAILLPYFMYEGIKRDYEKKFSRYEIKHNREYKIFGLDIIPSFDDMGIVPLRIYKEKHIDKKEKELRKEIIKDIVKEIENMAIK